MTERRLMLIRLSDLLTVRSDLMLRHTDITMEMSRRAR